ncbi:hypothetical protein DH2020_021043 [Rehmannia glutinosa]|uniref:DNA polymerase epsilon catalytic subunit n=1 Tax=Rehmannia glutinosa TaxID=99300 RepID=A0ABR0W9V3_REHGL
MDHAILQLVPDESMHRLYVEEDEWRGLSEERPEGYSDFEEAEADSKRRGFRSLHRGRQTPRLDKTEMDVEAYLRRRYEGQVAGIEIVEKEDLDLKNHLSGLHKCYLKISFDTVQQLMQVKNDLIHVVERNQAKLDAEDAYESILTGKSKQRPQDFIDCINDLREFDVPYHVRFAIDNDIRCGQWYDVSVSSAGIAVEKRTDLLQRAEVHVCAFDIETTKLPLKFPDAEYDSVMMISYMVDGQGYLIINRELGFRCDKIQGECRANLLATLIVLHGLNVIVISPRKPRLKGAMLSFELAVTKAKLGYDPLEVNPEDMVRFAKERPQAYKANVICPNKHQSDTEKFYRNKLLESETYIGGHVECLESGVFRSDLPTSFKLDPAAFEQLLDNLDRDLQYAIRVEGKMDLETVSNYDEVKNAIREKLVKLRDEPIREDFPLIYHLDVAAMYPNIILTNRLQAYKRVLDKPITELREAGICMRENPFYVDTVRSFFVDRRYEYKGLNKVWKGKLSEARASGNSIKIQEAQAMIIPASKEEGILIKKRYAVFNDDGTLAELKGFEIKREAELFDKFLHGSTLEECYSAVASVANRWLDLLDNQGEDIADSELLGYISESSTMSKSLADYGEQKSCAVTTAKRLADFLGDAMVKDKGLLCQYIVACEPKVANPVPRVVHPDWLHKKVREKEDKFRQRKLVDIFSRQQRDDAERVCGDPHANDHTTDEHNVTDMEDFRNTRNTHQVKPQPIVRSYGINNEQHQVKTSNTVESSEQNDRDEIGDKHSAQPLQEVFEESIDRNVDYRGWLELRKRKWKETREKRKRQRLDKSRTSNLINGAEVPSSILNHKQGQGRVGVTIDEDQFRSESKKLAAHLADPEVETPHHGPVIAVIECPNIQLLKSGIRALEEFPCVTIPCNARDSQYQALGWQVIAAKIGIQRCAASSQWLNERVTLSRYAHVPMGNFEVDWLIHTADIFLSRALRDHQQVLWISDNGIPDLGGTNEEVPCFIDEIHHLAVNALLKSNQLNEMEGGALFGLDQEMNPASYNSEKQYCFDEETSCAPAFRVLKQLIQRCLADAVTSGNVFADAILQNLYRWLCRLLNLYFYSVMQKVFALLMAELRKLGATIVFASFGRYNYGGIQARLEDRLTEECSKASVESMHDDYQFAQEEAAKRASVMGDLCTPSITASTAEILESQITDFLKKKIGSDFTDKLLKIVCDPSLHIKGRNKSQSDHNTSTGSLSSLNNIHKGDSALDFIKYVCAVLALDQKVQHEVLVMRRNLLKLVRIREFAPEAEFQNLFMSLTLPNVICR